MSTQTKFNKLYIEPAAMRKINYYTEAADGEVSGLGTIIQDKEKDWIVEDVFLLEQESSKSNTELKPESVSKLMEQMIKEDKDPGKLKFWWHSHDDMGVFWSGTDDECAETLSKEFAFSLVVNKSGEKRCRLDLYHPFRLTIDNLKVEELLEEDSELKEKCKKEVEEKVSTSKSWGMNDDERSYPGWHGYGRGYKGNWWDRGNQDSKVNIKECLAEDVERLMDLCASNEDIGGVFAPEVWDQYIHDTMKEIADKRFEDDADCNDFGTFDDELGVCKKCKVSKKCNIFTKIFQKHDERFEESEENKENVIEM